MIPFRIKSKLHKTSILTRYMVHHHIRVNVRKAFIRFRTRNLLWCSMYSNIRNILEMNIQNDHSILAVTDAVLLHEKANQKFAFHSLGRCVRILFWIQHCNGNGEREGEKLDGNADIYICIANNYELWLLHIEKMNECCCVRVYVSEHINSEVNEWMKEGAVCREKARESEQELDWGVGARWSNSQEMELIWVRCRCVGFVVCVWTPATIFPVCWPTHKFLTEKCWWIILYLHMLIKWRWNICVKIFFLVRRKQEKKKTH